MFVVPAPGKVTVDGDLGDWDLSAGIDSVFDEALAPRFTVRTAFMCDAQAFYIGAHFADETPLVNRHDPAVEPDRGWDGDALQVRLCSDPAAPYPLADSNSDRICHLTISHYTDRSLPVLQLQYGMDYHGMKVLTGPESGVAFLKDADGKGYTLEARVPWALLNAPTLPGANDRLALVMQPLWGDSSGWKQVLTFNDVIRSAGFSFQGTGMWGQAILLAQGHLPPAERPVGPAEQEQPLALKLPLPDPQAQVLSAAVFNGEGTLVRTLPVVSLSAERETRNAERQTTLRWDGLDDDGRPLPPDRYAVKLLTHRGIGQKWVTSLHNAGNPPWRTDDGTGSWGGDHGPPIAAASDAERVYLGWAVSEAGWSMIALEKGLTPEGKVRKLWGQHQVLDIGIIVTGLASDGERLFVAQDGKGWGADSSDPKTPNRAGVVIWDAKTGKPANFPFGKRELIVSEWLDALKSPELATHERMSIYHPPIPQKRFWERVRDHDFGPQEMGLNLLGIAVSGDVLYGSLYLEGKVVALNWRTGGKVKEFAVPRPVGLAVAKDGAVIAVSGRTIVRLDPVSGQVTPLVSEGLSWPWGLALDGEGRIHVTDCGEAMQAKVFDGHGKPIDTIGKRGGRPWVGRYDPRGMLRPSGITVDADGKVWVCEYDDTPRRVGVWSREGKLVADLLGPGAYAVEGIADEEHPTSVNVHHTLFEVDYATGKAKTVATLIRPELRGFQVSPDDGFMGRALKFRHTYGQDFLAHAGRGAVVIYRVKDLVGEPVAAIGPGGALPLHGFTKEDVPEAVREDFWRNPHAYAFWWSDANGDVLVQPDEFALEKVPFFWGLYWGAWVDEDLTIWSAASGQGAVFRVPVEEWTADGRPVYPHPAECQPLFTAQWKSDISSVLPDGDSVYLLEQEGGDAYGKGAKLQGISRYTLDGKRVWAYRKTWLGFGLEAPLAKPGDVVGAMKFTGKVELPSRVKLIAVNGYFGQFNLLSSDGLWVASLCKDNRYGPPADSTTVWPENFSGWFFRNRDNGKVYLIAGDTDARIWEVTGLETIRTGQAEIALTEADHQQALEVLARRQGIDTDLPPLRLARAAQAITIDGDLGDWDMASAATLHAGGGRAAKVALAYDGENLLAAFDVRDDSPMRNGGADPALLFKTGDVCEVFLGTDPSADPRRARPAAGDIRLLFSVMDGKPLCVLYQPVVREGDHAPRVFSSPVSAEAFDRVAVLDQAQVRVATTATGYTLEAAVPLAAFRFAPAPGLVIKGDVGVILSDPGGSRNVLRVDYANQETAVVNDIPTEARLEPGRWGMVRVE